MELNFNGLPNDAIYVFHDSKIYHKIMLSGTGIYKYKPWHDSAYLRKMWHLEERGSTWWIVERYETKDGE
jgi:hypothetical protein